MPLTLFGDGRKGEFPAGIYREPVGASGFRCHHSLGIQYAKF
jgi:hypothetical protein